MSAFFGFLVAVAILSIPILAIVFIIRLIMKKPCLKLGIAVLCCIGSIIPLTILGVITDPSTWCEHEYVIIEEVDPTCNEQGKVVKKCSLCDDEENEYPNALGHSWKEVSRVEATDDADEKISYQCTRCSATHTETIANPNPKGSKENPYVLNADTWYTDHCAGISLTNYVDKWVKITGTVLKISNYSDLKGYYLAGSTGQGLVCWVYSSNLDAQIGQVIEYVGKVSAQDPTHIEITDGKITSAEWPAEKN